MSSNEETNTIGREGDLEREDCHWRHHRRRFFWKVPLILIAVLVKIAVVMQLWNHLITQIFHLPELTYLHTLGIMVMIKLVFGFGHHHGGFGGKWGKFGHPHWHRRWHQMSPEEREKLREAFRKRWEE